MQTFYDDRGVIFHRTISRFDHDRTLRVDYSNPWDIRRGITARRLRWASRSATAWSRFGQVYSWPALSILSKIVSNLSLFIYQFIDTTSLRRLLLFLFLLLLLFCLYYIWNRPTTIFFFLRSTTTTKVIIINIYTIYCSKDKFSLLLLP